MGRVFLCLMKFGTLASLSLSVSPAAFFRPFERLDEPYGRGRRRRELVPLTVDQYIPRVPTVCSSGTSPMYRRYIHTHPELVSVCLPWAVDDDSPPPPPPLSIISIALAAASSASSWSGFVSSSLAPSAPPPWLTGLPLFLD